MQHRHALAQGWLLRPVRVAVVGGVISKIRLSRAVSVHHVDLNVAVAVAIEDDPATVTVLGSRERLPGVVSE